MDEYQARYAAHQARKREVLMDIIRERHSSRRFSNKDVSGPELDELLSVVEHCPSSCDRFGVKATVAVSRDEKALLSGVLVGATGWAHRAPVIILLFGDPVAYKANDEVLYNPFLDAGIIAQQVMLSAVSLGMVSCFINPQIRPINRDHFNSVFAPFPDAVYCGAIAVGYPHEES